MATSHDFLALPEDFELVHEFLRARGAELVAQDPTTSALIFHFPAFGRLTYWAADAVAEAATTATRKAAVLVALKRREAPEVPLINQYDSPVAGATPPGERISGVWRSSSVWFPTPKLRDTFPELARINNEFQRWLRKHLLVFDNTTREPVNAAPEFLAGFSGLVIKVFALPRAAERLAAGGYFVHNLTSEKTFNDFVRQAELRGLRVGG